MKQLDIILLVVALVVLAVGIYVAIKPESNIPCAEGYTRTETTCIKYGNTNKELGIPENELQKAMKYNK